MPQGSILGPILFNLYVNDIKYSCVDSCVQICQYADDTSIVFSCQNGPNAVTQLEQSLSQVVNWFTSNSLTVNPKKNKIITF